MLSFENIELAWALLIIIPLILLFAGVVKWKKKIAQSIGDHKLVKRLTQNYAHRKFKLKLLLMIAAIIIGVLAAMNLRMEKNDGSNLLSANKQMGIDIIIALDISKSMLAQDIKPTRLDQAKLLINKLIENLGNNRIGVVVFAGQAILQMPVTNDVGAAKMLISNLTPDMIPVQGTEIGKALSISNQALGNVADKKHKAVILITDGEDHDTRTNASIKELQDAGVVVFAIGVGSAEGTPIFDPAANDYVRDNNGQTVISKLGEDGLKKIAQRTNGAYFRLDNDLNAADKIARGINGMEKKLLNTPNAGAKNYISSFPILIGLMLLLLILDIFISDRKRKSV